MEDQSRISFTLLIACKNEEEDIRLAIDSSVAQRYPYKEILVVDDSNDCTRDIIREYADRGVLLVEGEGKGCCHARNRGIQKARGDVIVFLTADTRLDPDYLQRIAPYYEQGYDWVTVESQSFNISSIYARFIEMQHRYEESRASFNPMTTQGYSVRRTAVLEVGCIDGGDYPVNTCRDWSLGKKLTERGYKKMFDRSIVVPHKSPETFADYWEVRKTRGLFAAYQPYFMFGKSLPWLFIKFLTKHIIAALHFLLIVPSAVHVIGCARHSKSPVRDFFLFYYAHYIQILARSVGEWEGWFTIRKLRRQ